MSVSLGRDLEVGKKEVWRLWLNLGEKYPTNQRLILMGPEAENCT